MIEMGKFAFNSSTIAIYSFMAYIIVNSFRPNAYIIYFTRTPTLYTLKTARTRLFINAFIFLFPRVAYTHFGRALCEYNASGAYIKRTELIHAIRNYLLHTPQRAQYIYHARE